MCGRGGVAGDATMTSLPGVGSTGRQSQQGPEMGQRALRRQAVRRIENLIVWRQKISSFGPGFRLWKRRKEKEPKEGKAFHPGGMEEEWEMDVDVEDEIESRKSWMSKRGSCVRSCEKLKSSRVCRKRLGKHQDQPAAATA